MKHGAKQGIRRHGWMARLVQAQLLVSSLALEVEAPPGEDTWPARLIQAGAVLIGVGGMVLATWLLQRHSRGG